VRISFLFLDYLILFVDTGCNLSFISFVSACDRVSFLGPSVAKSAGLIFFNLPSL